MHYRPFTNPADFQAVAEAFLLRREAENNLILGNVARLINRPFVELPLFAVVEEDGEVVAGVMQTPPHKLVLTRCPPVAVAVVADAIARQRRELPGVLGPAESAEVFVTAWGKLSRQKIHRGRRMRVYEAAAVTTPQGVRGAMEPAHRDQLDTLAQWYHAFRMEVGDTAIVDDRQVIQGALREGRVFVWKDGEAVAMASWAGPTPSGVRINAVYTPPAWRSHGYASALTAALTGKLLETGKKSCFLFADLSNPTSNHIYRKIGYEGVCDYAEFRFEGE